MKRAIVRSGAVPLFISAEDLSDADCNIRSTAIRGVFSVNQILVLVNSYLRTRVSGREGVGECFGSWPVCLLLKGAIMRTRLECVDKKQEEADARLSNYSRNG